MRTKCYCSDLLTVDLMKFVQSGIWFVMCEEADLAFDLYIVNLISLLLKFFVLGVVEGFIVRSKKWLRCVVDLFAAAINEN